MAIILSLAISPQHGPHCGDLTSKELPSLALHKENATLPSLGVGLATLNLGKLVLMVGTETETADVALQGLDNVGKHKFASSKAKILLASKFQGLMSHGATTHQGPP